MLLQCVTGLLGVQALASAWASAWSPGRRRTPSGAVAVGSTPSPLAASWRGGPWIGLLVALLLLLPFSPLPFYLMTFWKDSCALVLFLRI